MKRRFILLGLLTVAIALTFYFVPKRHTDTKSRPLFSIPLSKVRKIDVKQRGAPGLSLVKRSGRWYITTPFRCDANGQQIQALLSLLRSPIIRSYPMESLSLRSAGLMSPAIIMVVNHTRYKFGVMNPVTMLRYVQVGKTVDLISDMLYIQLHHLPGFYASRQLVQFSTAGERLQEIRYPGMTLKFSNGKWSYASNRRTRGRPAAAKLAKTWETIQARQVIPIFAYSRASKLGVSLKVSGSRLRTEKFLVTGLSNGEIILSSASRKASYVLPKSDGRALALSAFEK